MKYTFLVDLRNMKKYNNIYPFLLLLVVVFICHFFTEKGADDIRYMHALDDQSYKDFITRHYYQWSSRILIDSTIVLFSRSNIWIWRVLDSVFFVSIAFLIFKIFGKKDEKNLSSIICFMILLFPTWMLSSTGWIATTVTYIWPISFGLIAMMPFKDFSNRIPIYSYFGLIPLCYSSNAEQMCCVLIAWSAIFYFLYYSKKRKQEFYCICCICVCLFFLLLSITCPGNHVRAIQETMNRFPEFADFNFVQKISLGIAVPYHRLFTFNLLYLILCVALLILSIYKKRNIIFSVILVLIPVFYSIYMILMSDSPVSYVVLGSCICPDVGSIHFIILIILSLVSITLLSCNLYSLFKEVFPLLIFFTGFCASLLMSFSPTIIASGERTMSILYICIIILLFISYRRFLMETGNSKYKKMFTALIAFSAIFNTAFFLFLHAGLFEFFK